MGLRDWIIDSERVATATPATFATLDTKNKRTVATIATVIVASSEKIDKTAIDEPSPIVDGLHSCLLCGGHLFNEGSRGGYFCVECQGLPEGATVARVVRGVTPRKRNVTSNAMGVTKDVTKRTETGKGA